MGFPELWTEQNIFMHSPKLCKYITTVCSQGEV